MKNKCVLVVLTNRRHRYSVLSAILIDFHGISELEFMSLIGIMKNIRSYNRENIK